MFLLFENRKEEYEYLNTKVDKPFDSDIKGFNRITIATSYKNFDYGG